MIKNKHHSAWTDGLDVKNRYYYCRGPGFASHHLLSSSLPSHVYILTQTGTDNQKEIFRISQKIIIVLFKVSVLFVKDSTD